MKIVLINEFRYYSRIQAHVTVSLHEAEWLRAINIEFIRKDSQILDTLHFVHLMQLSFWVGIEKSTNRTWWKKVSHNVFTNQIVPFWASFNMCVLTCLELTVMRETFQQTQQICRIFYFNFGKMFNESM